MTVGQSRFAAALWSPGTAVPGLSDPAGAAAGKRLDVYRNNVVRGLTEALRSAFPVVARVLGPAGFDRVARAFAQAHPPASPRMQAWGDGFAEHIASDPDLARLGYLPDAARLDHAMRQSYHAADADADHAGLAALSPDALAGARLRLAPSARLVRSRWPIHAIWSFNMVEGAARPEMAAEDVLVLRPEYDPVPRLLPAGGGAFVAGLLEGRTLGDAHAEALRAASEFDPAPVLALLLADRAIAEVTT